MCPQAPCFPKPHVSLPFLHFTLVYLILTPWLSITAHTWIIACLYSDLDIVVGKCTSHDGVFFVSIWNTCYFFPTPIQYWQHMAHQVPQRVHASNQHGKPDLVSPWVLGQEHYHYGFSQWVPELSLMPIASLMVFQAALQSRWSDCEWLSNTGSNSLHTSHVVIYACGVEALTRIGTGLWGLQKHAQPIHEPRWSAVA